MASPAANAVKYDLAQRKTMDAMNRISAATGVPLPPPPPKTESNDARRAVEAERTATFLAAVADKIGK
jgi:hypothetical protein